MDQNKEISSLESQIESRIAALDGDIELIALELLGRDNLRLFIDRPGGIGLEHCELVTRELSDLLSDYALEVSSPGLDRPLTKPAHFERFLGETVKVKTREPIDGRRNFTGRLAGAGPESIELDLDDGRAEIPLDRVHRSNLVPQLPEVHR
jgi:ribosome maturation factor RimP